jgi:hypothetical protein
MPKNKNFRIELAKHLTLTEMENKLVLFSKTTGDFFGLNETALFLLRTLLESDFEKTVQIAAKEFNENPTVIEQDLIELLAELESQKLLHKIEM